jgi:hypothetical protein
MDAEMPQFKFQVLQPSRGILADDLRDLPSSAELWGHLEVIAIQFRKHKDLLLVVRNEDDGIVALTGIANVIVSLERCRRTTCPIKDLLAGRDDRLDACAPCMSIAVRDIPRLRMPDVSLRPLIP